MKIYKKNVGVYSSNSYILSDEENNAVIIDVGGDSYDLFEYMKKEKLSLKAIILTHGHFDHVIGANEMKELSGAPIYIAEEDYDMVRKLPFMLNDKMRNMIDEPVNVDFTLKDKDVLNFGKLTLNIIACPGHSKGSIAIEAGENLFAGDTIFYHSVGRTDLYGGSENEIINSVRKILDNKKDYIIYPGHGPNTTSKEERENNPYFS